MTEKEMLKISIEEFSRIQRYLALKVILTASGINLTEIDYMKE